MHLGSPNLCFQARCTLGTRLAAIVAQIADHVQRISVMALANLANVLTFYVQTSVFTLVTSSSLLTCILVCAGSIAWWTLNVC